MAFAVVSFVLIALTPVTLTVKGGVSAEEVANGSWETVPRAVPTRIVIRSDGPGTAAIGIPALRWPEVFSREIVGASRGFEADAASGGFVAKGPGRIVFRGVFGDFSIALLANSTVDSVTVVRSGSGSSRRVLLVPGEIGSLPSPSTTLQRTTSFLWRSVPARLENPEKADLEGSVGNYRIDARGENALSFSDLAPKALLLFLQGLIVFGAASLLVIFGWAVVRSLDPTRNSSRRWIALQAISGVSLLALAGNTLAYFLPTGLAAWIVFACGLLLIAARLARSGSRARLSADAQLLLKSLGIAWLPAAFLFFPVFHWGSWYAGSYNTDLFEYAHLSSLLHETPMFGLRGSTEALNSGLLTSGAGFEWRSIDSVLGSTVSVLTFSSAITGIVIVAIAMFLLFAIGIFALVKEGSSRPPLILVAVLLLLSPALVLLFVENYQSQYFFVTLIPGLALSFRELAANVGSDPSPPARYRYLLAGAIAAAALAAFPYFTVFALVALAAAAIVLRLKLKAAMRVLLKTAVATLALLNLGAITFLYLGETTQWQDNLDAIATNVLLQPYSDSQLASVAAGTTPYSWRWPFVEPEPHMGWLGGQIWSLGGSAWTPGVLEFLAVALFAGVLISALDWKRSLRRSAFVASAMIVLAFVALSLLFIVTDSSYSTLKVGWTAVALFPMVVVSGILRERWTWMVAVALIPLAVLWVRTDLLDRANWMINREGAAASLSHSSIQPELVQVRRLLESSPESVGIIRGPQPILGSDRDNVAHNHTKVLIRELGIDCEGCADSPLVAAGLPRAIKCSSAPQMIVRIGRSGRRMECGRELVYTGPTVEVYDRIR